jgi:hypothetical protein
MNQNEKDGAAVFMACLMIGVVALGAVALFASLIAVIKSSETASQVWASPHVVTSSIFIDHSSSEWNFGSSSDATVSTTYTFFNEATVCDAHNNCFIINPTSTLQ